MIAAVGRPPMGPVEVRVVIGVVLIELRLVMCVRCVLMVAPMDEVLVFDLSSLAMCSRASRR